MSSVSLLLRQRGRQDSGKVGMVELFFDLLFVFAVTQLSHSLLAHLTPDGALGVALLLLAVWWVWIYTSWVTNWLDLISDAVHWRFIRRTSRRQATGNRRRFR
jgi:low temperature requirement protein LtrA